MITDIEDGLIDIIVVYKIEPLSRALMDLPKLVGIFDRTSATFVSATQSFNTTTSMGRLTLNILLSFAQVEREVKVTPPVVAWALRLGIYSTPFRAIRVVPATGLAMARVQLCAPELQRF